MTEALNVEICDNDVLCLTFNAPNRPVNTLAKSVREELLQLIDSWEQQSNLRGLLIRSGKPGQFIAGADLNELASLRAATPQQIAEELDAGHALFGRLSRLPFPVVALIDGACMGGGTELVLACDDRIVSNAASTKMALPEVTLGLIPGWGGTQRMPRLIGIHHGIDLVCQGTTFDGVRARELGFAFDCVPTDRLQSEGLRLIEILQTDGKYLARREQLSQPMGLSADQLGFACAVAEGKLKAQQTASRNPAPLAALAAIREGVNVTLEAGLLRERAHALEVTGSETSSNLISVFFLNQQVKRDRGVDDPSVTARQIDRVGVLGGGLMGAGLSAAHARRDVNVTLVDVDEQRVTEGVERMKHVVTSRMRIGRATPHDLESMLARTSTATSTKVFADCDIVIEAIPEKESLKIEAFKQLSKIVGPETILASNTSTISITRMSAAVEHPNRFVGMHFFYPVDRMQLVEVIRGKDTSDETVATVAALASRIQKVPIVVQDCPGFLVNRLLLPYMSEAVQLVCEGALMDDVDQAAVAFGLPMGPIALHDLVGLDTAYSAADVLQKAYHDRALLSGLLGELVESGRRGKKSGSGFRRFTGKKGRPEAAPEIQPLLEKHRIDNRQFSREELTDRMILPMLLEATRVLEEHVVKDPAHVDLGMILATGFPAFRGGLLRWADSVGAAALVERLQPLRSLGKRFEPTNLLLDLARSGRTFYPAGK